jgi:putative flippase GtrA
MSAPRRSPAVPISPFRMAGEWPPIIVQGLRFGAVGGLSTFTHVFFFMLGIEWLGLWPLWSNLLAFGVAVIVSFSGHFYWTFRVQTESRTARAVPARAAFLRFLAVALTGLVLNSLAVYAVVNVLGLPYAYAIVLMLTAVPASTFMLSKFWAFA